MAQRGAKNLIFLSRSGASNAEARELLESLQKLGVRVEAPKCDISDFDSLESVLIELRSQMPPIKGCIQSSMVLRVSGHSASGPSHETDSILTSLISNRTKCMEI